MNYLDNNSPELLSDSFPEGELKPLNVFWGSEKARALYQSSLVQGFLQNLQMPEEDKLTLMDKGALDGMVIEEWPEFLAVPIEGIGLSDRTGETFWKMAEENLCLAHGDYVGWCIGGMLFIGQLERPDTITAPGTV